MTMRDNIIAKGVTSGGVDVPLRVNASGELTTAVADPGVVDSGNSTTSNLGGAATFTGTWIDILAYTSISIIAAADQIGTLYADFSEDGSTVHRHIQLSDGTTSDFGIHFLAQAAQYFRVVLVNGATPQTSVYIQTILNVNARVSLPTSRMAQTLGDYSDVLNTRAVLVGKTEGGDYLNVPVNGQGELIVALPTTAFGELSAESKTPQVQMRYPYNVVPPDIGQILTNKSGSSVTVATAQASVTCAGVAESFSQIRTLDTLRYGPGQGAVFMGTCAFTTGVALSSQVFGPGDDDEGLYFGYNGTLFGVLRKAYGSLEIKSLTITAGASGAGDITITMDDTAVPVTLVGTETIAEVCAAIVAEADAFGDAGRGWEVHTDDNVSVEFISLVAENASGTFSFVDTDTTGVTADAFAEEVAGVAPTDTWVAQTAWNRDTMINGNALNPSGMHLDPTKGNVYRVQFQYLGYGGQEFYIEDPATDKLVLVHAFEYANSNTIPWCQNPTFHLNLIAKTEAAYSGGALTMKTASMAGFIQGNESREGIRRGVAAEKAMTTTEQVLLILHSELDFNGLKNKITTFPDFVDIGHSNTSKVLTVRLIKNPTSITGAVALTDVQAGVSVMQYSTTGTAVVGGSQLLSFEVSPANPAFIDLAKLTAKIRPGERYVFTGQMQSGSADTNIGTSWVERI